MKTSNFEYLFAEIGSTTTVLSAFARDKDGKLFFVGQGESYTTVSEGDVSIGIKKALEVLKEKLRLGDIQWKLFLATSSAAGGLKMTVHGLVYDMTVKAAREAALGAGGVIKHVTAGKLTERDLKKIMKYDPRLVLLAGGVDYGESETVIHNAEVLSDLLLDVPIVYAGNVAAREDILEILEEEGKKVLVTDNVYPKIDQLNVEPTRKIIREVFGKNIVKAPGMEKIYSIADKEIIPTPAAVMMATELLAELHEDVMTVDIGGATTDIDSVTEGSPEIQKMTISPEPVSKRTVEGDLGVFVNASHVINYIGEEDLGKEFPDIGEIKENLSPYPKSERNELFMARLAKYCLETSIRRHAGHIRHLYGPSGKTDVAEGKDLTAIKLLVGTGGVLSRSGFGKEIMSGMKDLSRKYRNELLPGSDLNVAVDKNYILAAIGAISLIDKEDAFQLLKDDIEFL